ncbi:MAG: flagellin [Paracoccaceae bacterium]
MSLISLGDLAQSLMLRQHNAQIRQEVNRLSEEVATGRVTDTSSHLGGNFVFLAEVERGLGLIQGYSTSVSEVGILASAMQNALGQIQDASGNLSSTLLETNSGGLNSTQTTAARTALDTFSQIVSALNSHSAGRSLFAGNATDRPALATSDTLVSALQGAISGQTTAQGVMDAVNLWFDAPSGGFEAIAYLGSTEGLAPYRLDRNGTVDLNLRADGPVLRATLKYSALAALASDPSLNLPDAVRSDLLRQAANGLLDTQDGLAGLRADLGFAEARIEEGRVRLSSEKTSLEIARNTLLSVDMYEKASLLETAQSQLESLYAVTVRLSRLSLSEFMR